MIFYGSITPEELRRWRPKFAWLPTWAAVDTSVTPNRLVNIWWSYYEERISKVEGYIVTKQRRIPSRPDLHEVSFREDTNPANRPITS